MTTNRGVMGRSWWPVVTGVAAVLSVAIPATPAAATLPVAHAGSEPRLPSTEPDAVDEAPFVPADDKPATLPTSLADGVSALSRPTPADRWHAAWSREGLSIREIVGVAARERILLPITAAGILMIVIASFARRRHRRQIGWGVLPERPARRDEL